MRLIRTVCQTRTLAAVLAAGACNNVKDAQEDPEDPTCSELVEACAPCQELGEDYDACYADCGDDNACYSECTAPLSDPDQCWHGCGAIANGEWLPAGQEAVNVLSGEGECES